MSLLVPNERDQRDAYADIDQDNLYYEHIHTNDPCWLFEPVHGFFKQSSSKTDDMLFNYTEQNFGIEKSWDVLVQDLKEMNKNSPENVRYKLLFLARHGEGWHNVAFAKFGQDSWSAKWKYLGTDGDLVWGPDAELTPLGLAQAQENCDVWCEQLKSGAPLPTKFYVSPLLRSLLTLEKTWEGQDIPTPVVNESLRETIGQHLCHQRSTKSVIRQKFPFVQFEENFDEDDKLAVKYSTQKEQLHQQFLRVNHFLQYLYDNDPDEVISITSHAGTIRLFITVVGHRKFTIPTGGMIPMVVKGTRK